MRIIYAKVDDPCCPNPTDASVSDFVQGSLTMKQCVVGQRRLLHLYLVPDDFDLESINIESWAKAPAHAHAEPPTGNDNIAGLVQLDVLLGDRIEDLAVLASSTSQAAAES